MKKTVTINISGHMFYIDEDAYKRLRAYLDNIEQTFRRQESGNEIITDIESRIAEIFNERIKHETGVVTIEMVKEVVTTMGEPEEFAEDGQKAESEPATVITVKPKKRLFRDIDNRVFGGVCSGVAAYFNIDILLVRIITVLLIPLTSGAIILIYLVLWMALPPAITTAQKLEMRGENITINNIEKTIKDEYEQVKKNFDNFKKSDTYQKGKSFFGSFTHRDKSTLIIVAVIVGAALLFNIPPLGHIIHAPFTAFTGFTHHIAPTFNHVFFSGAFGLVLILLVIGLVFKTLLKIILYIIAFFLLGSFVLNVIGWLLGGFLVMC